MSKDVCVPVKSSKPRQECVMKPRQECDIRQTTETVKQCGVVPAPRRAERRCTSEVSKSKIVTINKTKLFVHKIWLHRLLMMNFTRYEKFPERCVET